MYQKQNSPSSYVLSPYKDGSSPSSFWRAISGSVTISSNKYSVAATSEIIALVDCRYTRLKLWNVDLGLTGSQTPTNLNNDVEFGLKEIVSGAKATFLMDQSADAMVISIVDEDGNAQTATVAWVTTWNGAATEFEIQWFNDRVVFKVAGAVVGEFKKLTSGGTTYKVPEIPLNFWIKTTGTDSPKIGLVYIDKAEESSVLKDTSVTLSAGDIEIGAVEIKNGTDDTRMDVETAGADAKSNTFNGAAVVARLMGFNGTTWDRLRTAIVAATSTFTGLLNSIPLGRYNATPPTATDGQVLPLQLDVNGNLKTAESNSAAIAASLSVLDDWDESDRLKANIIVGQAGISAGAGSVAGNTPRVTLAADDPAVASLSTLDDWDESDRAKVNPIVGQAGVAGGAGTVGSTTQRVTLASDDPGVTSLGVMDDWDESDRAKVNPIAGQAGVQGGSGAVTALTQRVVLATDVALPTGTNVIGKVNTVDGSYVDENGNILTIKRAFANVAASQTDSNIVSAVASKVIRVLSVVALAGGTATNLTFNTKPGGAGSAISMLFANGANGGEVLPYNKGGWFQTSSGEGLTVTTGAGSTTGIQVMYVEV